MARQQATTTSWTHLIVYQVVKDQGFPRSASASKPYVTHKTKEHWVGLEPTSSHYKSEILAARRPVQNQIVSCLFVKLGCRISGTGGIRTLTELGKSQPCCHNTSVPNFYAACYVAPLLLPQFVVCIVGCLSLIHISEPTRPY